MPPAPPAPGSSLAEVLAALSLVSDLGRGRPPEEAMRACVVASRLAADQHLTASDTRAVYWTSLLRSVGCTATSHEYAALYGDDVAVRGRGDAVDARRPGEVIPFLWEASRTRRDTPHVGAFLAVIAGARAATTEGARADCEVGARMARRFGLDRAVQEGIDGVFERWDGKGARGRRAEAIPLASRFAAAVTAWVLFVEELGPEGARARLRAWSGGVLDPAVVSALLELVGEGTGLEGTDDAWCATVEAEPGPRRDLPEAALDEVARAFADAVDLKSPWLHGHSTAVAHLAATAAATLGLPDAEVASTRRAGLLHDIGRVGVSSCVWDRPGPLTTTEREEVRLHPYHTERVLGRAPALAGLARTAGMHHERVDGRGYHRGAPAAMLDEPARVLAAADLWVALTSDRPHRPALPAAEAARIVAHEALGRDAASAVLAAAGRPAHRRPSAPAGLTERELEVVALLVHGAAEKEVAARLRISPSTVHTHVVHIYEKAGVSTRAGLAMFAMEHDLVRAGGGDPPP